MDEIGNSKAVYKVFNSKEGGKISHGGRRGWDGFRGKQGRGLGYK